MSKGAARLRVTLSAAHSVEEVKKLREILEAKDELDCG